MLEDIKKILNISKHNSIVVMDEGRPAYVIVPFEEYSKNMEIINKGGNILSDCKNKNTDMDFNKINSIIESELDRNDMVFSEDDGDKIGSSIKDRDVLNLREVKLKDLPF